LDRSQKYTFGFTKRPAFLDNIRSKKISQHTFNRVTLHIYNEIKKKE